MTMPGGVQQFSGGTPPFESAANQTIAAMRQRLDPGRRLPVLTPQERTEAAEAAKEASSVCRWCVGFHPLPGGVGCPRLASVELDGDGKIKAATFWPGKRWAKGRVLFVEDVHESGEEGGHGDDVQ